MLTEKQLTEIREHLERAQNPLFFFDNDVDGLCSFLILQRHIGRGRGIAIKGLPSLPKTYFKRVEELNSDYVFLLDRPEVDDDFVELAKQRNIPVVVIDHHQSEKTPNAEFYYNTHTTSKKNEPTSYLCYKAAGKKEDLWLAALGCIGDCFIPEFLDDFKKQNPELVDCKYKTAFDVLYNTQLGKIAMILNFALKDTTTNVVSLLKYLMKAKGPHDILEENARTKNFLKRYELINKCVKKIVEKAEEHIDKKNKILFSTYTGKMSLSQHASDELIYRHPDFVIVLGFVKGNFAKFSIRGYIDVRKAALDAIKDIDDAKGGGHANSCGAQMTADNVENFRENFLREIEKARK